jgi:hypothetical protein
MKWSSLHILPLSEKMEIYDAVSCRHRVNFFCLMYVTGCYSVIIILVILFRKFPA